MGAREPNLAPVRPMNSAAIRAARPGGRDVSLTDLVERVNLPPAPLERRRIDITPRPDEGTILPCRGIERPGVRDRRRGQRPP